MKVLIAEDDPVSRRLLEATLTRWDHEVVLAADGAQAWDLIQADPPPIAILDWMMPHLDGVEICRRLRTAVPPPPIYLILLTAKGRTEDLVAGLQAGADDYVVKPFDRSELWARLQGAVRTVTLQRALADRVRELEDALARVQQLQGLLPMCAYCKRIRNDRDYWQQVESYVSERSAAQFSHGICPGCYETVVKPQLAALRDQLRPPAAADPGPPP